MTNTATPAPIGQLHPVTEKAREFFALAQLLIDCCDKTQRTIVMCYMQAICEMADEREAREDAEREHAWNNWHAEREQAWANWYAEQAEKGEW